MIVDRVRLGPHSETTERLSARVRWSDRSLEVGVTAPTGSLVEDDASPFLPMTLLPAMLAGEDLAIEGPVSSALLHRAEHAAIAYATWQPDLKPASVAAAEVAAPSASAEAGHALFFSLGVDSLYSAAIDRGPLRPVTDLVFVTDFPPVWGPEVASARLSNARQAARDLGLGLMLVESNIEELTAGRGNWADVHGGALAAVGLALGRRFDEVRIATTDSFASLVPYGSHPALDPLFSTEATAISHDELTRSRTGKLALLARDRPDLLAHLTVCFAEERVDNCGRCGKCLLTMSGLLAAGALGDAALFDDHIDLDALGELRISPLQSRIHFSEAARALGDTGEAGEVRRVIIERLRRSARPPLRRRAQLMGERLLGKRPSAHPSWTDPNRGFDTRFHDEALALLTRGESARSWDARPAPEMPGRLRPSVEPDP